MQLSQLQTKGDAKFLSLLRGALPHASDFMKQGFFCDLMPSSKNLTQCSTFHQHHVDGYGDLFPEGKKSSDDLHSLNSSRNYSELSTSSTMSEDFTPTIVYQRRRHRKRSAAFFTIDSCAGTKPNDVCNSAISSEGPSMAAQDNLLSVSDCAAEKVVRSPITVPVEYNLMGAASSNGCLAGEETGFEEALVSNMDRGLNVNDNCSSSRSNLERSSTSLKNDVDEAGECSSSGALTADVAPAELSERHICISILISQGLLDKTWTRQDQGFHTENSGACGDNYCSKPCNVCEKIDSTKNMLICDNCEDACHVPCYYSHITVLPVGEWLCGSCLKKKHKIMKDKSSSNSGNISNEIVGRRCSASEGELGSLQFMFRDSEPYMSNVRIGDEFQADVPYWHGPTDEECNLVDDPLETDPCNNLTMQHNSALELDSIKTLKRGPIGNWLQCRAVIEGVGEGVDGTTCAKWRRAPLFEVQTDAWECFSCVLWDPAHADCAVPQELDTEEVMKQLKYIEMLRPRLSAKRRRLDCSKSSKGSQDGP